MPDKLLKDLNPEQQQAVLATEGPVLILAGAGSGKTRVITYRIAYLVQEKHIPPENILAITFTNKAANEMKERIKKILSKKDTMILSEQKNNVHNILASQYHSITPYAGTFHSFCARILRKDGKYLGFSPNYLIYDEAVGYLG